MSDNNTPKIPDSVVESLARATLAAMRKEKERPNGLEASGFDKNADNEDQDRPAQMENKTEK